jgi:flagellin-like protein
MKMRRRRVSCRAASEVLGTILLVALTIAVGFAAWAWIRSSAIKSESGYNSEISGNINQLNERFVIINANFSTQTVSVWFYDEGSTTITVNTLLISNSTWASSSFSLALQVTSGSVKMSTSNIGTKFTSGSLYQFKAVGLYGSVVYYQQVR